MSKANQDQRAEEHLGRQGYETYRPMARIPKMRRGRRVYVVESLFPRYMFIRLDVENDNWGPIRSTYGVNGLVKFGQSVPQVPDELIDFIRQHEHDFEKRAIDLVDFKANDSVSLVEGPLKGFQGIFQSLDGKDRALLLVTVMGVQKKIRVPVHYIR